MFHTVIIVRSTEPTRPRVWERVGALLLPSVIALERLVALVLSFAQ